MKTRIGRVLEWAPTALAAAGVVWAAIATFSFVVSRAPWGTNETQRVVRVTGINVPKDELSDLLVYTDQGVFAVSDHLQRGRGREDPWFLFAIGGTYRVSTTIHAAISPRVAPLPVIQNATRLDVPRLASLTFAD